MILRLVVPAYLAVHHAAEVLPVGAIHLPAVVTGAHHVAHALGQMNLVTCVGHEVPSTGWTQDPLFKCASHLSVTAGAPLFTHMTPQVAVPYVAIVAIVVSFYKGGHRGNHAIVIVRVVNIQFVLRLVGSLIDNGVEEIPGDDVQLVGRARDAWNCSHSGRPHRTPSGKPLKKKRAY